jgi:Ion channel
LLTSVAASCKTLPAGQPIPRPLLAFLNDKSPRWVTVKCGGWLVAFEQEFQDADVEEAVPYPGILIRVFPPSGGEPSSFKIGAMGDPYAPRDLHGPAYDLPTTVGSAQALLEVAVRSFSSHRSTLQERLKELARNPVSSMHYVDFLYFSVITQTTVGYGDILPNATFIRMLVSVQLVVAVFVLGVGINVVSRAPPRRNEFEGGPQ